MNPLLLSLVPMARQKMQEKSRIAIRKKEVKDEDIWVLCKNVRESIGI
jgi:hypothetical protein